MTNEEHQAHAKAFHLVAGQHHGRMSKPHRAIAKHHETSDPKLAQLHHELADVHSDHADYHEDRAACFGDDVEAKATGGSDLKKLAKALSERM